MFHDSQNACGFAADIFINLLLFWSCHNLTTLYFPSYQERERAAYKNNATQPQDFYVISFLHLLYPETQRTCKNVMDTAF